MMIHRGMIVVVVVVVEVVVVVVEECYCKIHNNNEYERCGK